MHRAAAILVSEIVALGLPQLETCSLEDSIFLGAHAVCEQSSVLLSSQQMTKALKCIQVRKHSAVIYWIAVRAKVFHLGIHRIQVYPRTLKEQNFLII
jgi:hypothetical protein